MNLRPCAVPVLASGEQALAFWNAAISHSGNQIAIPGSETSFAFQPGNAPSPKKGGFTVTLSGGQSLLLAIEDVDFDEWTGTDLSYEELNSLPATIRKAIDRSVVGVILDLLPQEMRERVKEIAHIDPSRMAKEAKTRSVSWIELRIGTDDRVPVSLMLGFRIDDLSELLGRQNVEAVISRSEKFAGISVPVAYSLGDLSLPQQEVDALEPGDLILFEAHSNKTVFYVTAPHARYGFTLLDKQWLCSEVRPHRIAGSKAGKPIMEPDDLDDDDEAEKFALLPEEGDATPAMEEPEPLGTIPILLDFELGRLSVPVGQLEQWQPGTIVELEPPRIDDAVAVTIRANGQVIGTGDLVRIGERLAIRIARIGRAAPESVAEAMAEE